MAVFVITASQRQKPLFGESRTSRAVSSRLPDQVTAAHPLHDQRCVLLGRFLPHEMSGVEDVESALGQSGVEVLSISHRNERVPPSGGLLRRAVGWDR